jgi:hypothetical protein
MRQCHTLKYRGVFSVYGVMHSAADISLVPHTLYLSCPWIFPFNPSCTRSIASNPSFTHRHHSANRVYILKSLTAKMRFSTFSAIATFAVTALAQDLSAIPTCAISCVGDGLAGTGCNQIDVACICNSSAWISELSCCVSTACQPADQAGTSSMRHS